MRRATAPCRCDADDTFNPAHAAQVARSSADNSLLRFSAKGHLLHAALCALCTMPPDAVRERLERYKDIDINLEGSRECKLIEVGGEGDLVFWLVTALSGCALSD